MKGNSLLRLTSDRTWSLTIITIALQDSDIAGKMIGDGKSSVLFYLCFIYLNNTIYITNYNINLFASAIIKVLYLSDNQPKFIYDIA